MFCPSEALQSKAFLCAARLAVVAMPILPVATQSVLSKEPVPEGWSLCDFLERISSQSPFVLAGGVPERSRGLTSARLAEIAGPREQVVVQASGNGFIGPNNYDHNILFKLSMNELGRLMDTEGDTLRKAELSVQVAQSQLPKKLREFIWDLLPTWVPFPAHETRLWLDVPGSPRATFLHHDAFHNIYMMLRGTKTFQLIPPSQSHKIRVAEAGTNYFYTNDYWRYLATTKGKPSAHASWRSMGADGNGPANLNSAERFIVTLQPGDVLVLPRGWWHTTMQDGQEAAIAINFWFDTSNPIERILYQSQVDLQKIRESTPLPEPALQIGTATGLDQDVLANTFYGLQAYLKQTVPWMNAEYLEEYPDEAEESDVHPTSWYSETETPHCIRWSFETSNDVQAKLRRTSLARHDIDSMSGLLEIVNAKRGDAVIWDRLREAYLSIMGGTWEQPLQHWRTKLQSGFVGGEDRTTELEKTRWALQELDDGVAALKNEAAARASNNHTLLGLLRKCDTPPVGSLPNGIKESFFAFGRSLFGHHLFPRAPTCDEAYIEIAGSLVGACRCVVERCSPKEASDEKIFEGVREDL